MRAPQSGRKRIDMKHQELIERYIYAATRFMRKEEKEDCGCQGKAERAEKRN